MKTLQYFIGWAFLVIMLFTILKLSMPLGAIFVALTVFYSDRINEVLAI